MLTMIDGILTRIAGRSSLLPVRCRRGNRNGFSLIEVILSIGVVSFALMALIGTLPVGLQTVQDARVQAARSNITQQLRGVLQQISFNNPSNSFDISSLKNPAFSFYYTEEGMETDSADKAYYRANFTVTDAKVGAGTSTNNTITFTPTNAQMVKVTLTYPQSAPVTSQKSTSFSLFSAKQGSN